MISGDIFAPGVAEDASLYASASAFRTENPEIDTEELPAQFIATRDNGNVRAINMSYIIPFDPNGVPDGNSNFTQFVDWSASEHNVLYVVAGREKPILPASDGQPQDNFNGMTVAMSRRNLLDGVFREVDPDNDFTLAADVVGDRTTIDILAPGRDIEVVDLGGGNPSMRTGTSYAAPHVVGTVALLQEFAETKIPSTGWDADARRHEVMKAVLMNSADKLEDDGTFAPMGNLLGMERTVVDQNGDNWLASEANDDSVLTGIGDIPLDDQMGAGHFNAKRALQQFLPGEFDSDGADVPSIGWDYGMTSGQGDTNNYRLGETLQAGSYISITLAWDREVTFLSDRGTQGVFDDGDTFRDYTDTDPYADDVISDLDLKLFGPVFLEAQSVSLEGTLEHIFFEIPVTGQYRFEVEQFDADAGPQDYGLAWWYGLAPEPTLLGDFDIDGDVDGADFLKWQRDLGDAASLADWENGFGGGGSQQAMAGGGSFGPASIANVVTAIGEFSGANAHDIRSQNGDYDGDLDVDTVDVTGAIKSVGGGRTSSLASNAELLYDPLTGNVQLDVNGNSVLSFVLVSDDQFNAVGDISDLDDDVIAGLTSTIIDNSTSIIGWASALVTAQYGFDGPAPADLGTIFPADLDENELAALLTDATFTAGFGVAGQFDLVVVGGSLTAVPEPATWLLLSLGVLVFSKRYRS